MIAKPITLHPPASFDEWLADLKWTTDCLEDDARFQHATIEAHFERKYGAQSGPRGRRVMAAIRYFMRHRQDFDEGVLGINGQSGFVPGNLLLEALLVIFNNAREDQLGHDWSVDLVRGIVAGLEKARQLER